MRVEHQIRAFEQIFKSYDGAQPLHRFLFAYFKQHKQMGSSDRRWATRYIYSFFRLGKALLGESPEQRLAIADFLCNDSPSLVVDTYLPDIKDKLNSTIEDKISCILKAFPTFKLADVFKFDEPLSEGIDSRLFTLSSFIQPDLFIRVKLDKMQALLNDLKNADLTFEQVGEKTLALPNGTKLEQVLPAPKR